MMEQLRQYRLLKSAVRITMGSIFLWAFFDKLFGLGFATTADKAWITGASPTSGFLTYGTQGPLAWIYQVLAGNPVIDWIYMIGLLAMGLGLVLGIMVRLAGYGAIAFMVILWTAVLFPENNPLIDEHVVYALVLLWLTRTDTTKQFGLSRWWCSLEFVKQRPILR
ncbi:MAG: DoxX family membrane protein [Candidatus Kerfeldbacteria bacterium]|nr:DoxX family membrane protein [Candidatus Kerfeldbacteria bacterium]